MIHSKLLTRFLCLLIVSMGIRSQAIAQDATCEHTVNQCGTQSPLHCDCAGTETEFTICHAGTNYIATVWLCSQSATTALIDNPCTSVYPSECDYAVNSVSWIKKICVPQALKNMGLLAIYQAIINGTDLCCNNFLGVTIPKCNTGTICATPTNTGVYCHILALPKCLKRTM